ncbi:MAG: hypothetical protein JHC93_07055 [Parachlamydiales bacterium]|nr:hypothetical protein [Parachlamydiales bacterium]
MKFFSFLCLFCFCQAMVFSEVEEEASFGLGIQLGINGWPQRQQSDTWQFQQLVRIHYTNHRHETSWRYIIPQSMYFGTTQWHQEIQWLLQAYDVEKKDWRVFALQDIQKWEPYNFKK